MKTNKYFILPLVTCVGFLGCEKKIRDHSESDIQVYHGREAQDKTGVFRLSASCSAVLVADRTLLSAGHCFGANWEQPANEKPTLDGAWTAYYEPLNKLFPVTKVQVAPHKITNQISIHPDDISRPGFDLAIVTIEDWGEIPTEHIRQIVPPDADRVFRRLSTSASIQGYGWTDDRLILAQKQQEGSFYWVSRWGLYGQESYFTGPSNSCAGDSGGPVFVKSPSESQVAGITIRHALFYLDKDCTTDDTITTNLAHPAVREWLRAKSDGNIHL